jgi:Na+-transporting methylmalonyl-CoA/oxaloacetate decarboxylase gamma subunit
MAKMNTKLSKKGTFGTTMGVTSIIAILVILVLIVFAALSITTAKADLRLSEKTAASTTDYYKADTAAEEKVAEVAAAVAGGAGWEGKLGSGYEVADGEGGKVVSYEVKIDENKALSVRLLVGADGGITRELWQVHSTSEWAPDKDIQLIIE